MERAIERRKLRMRGPRLREREYSEILNTRGVKAQRRQQRKQEKLKQTANTKKSFRARTPEVMASPMSFTVVFMPVTGSGMPDGGDDSELNVVFTSPMLESSTPMPPCERNIIRHNRIPSAEDRYQRTQLMSETNAKSSNEG